MRRHLRAFGKSESGAVTVDWVVLTAAIGFLSVGLVVTIRDAATDPADSVGAQLSGMVTED
ncbi:hypothetical protein [Pseudoroseicyclus sp. CXY001]|uniref:hypothetical protein n=1 Tax=Pseudoroseicyclus sp. CXY001 TaxID=3242492 RepID=UPI00357109F1